MKNKIGLSLAFTGTNYGALWQAYATQRIIEQLGYDTEIIDYQKEKKHEFIHCIGAYYGYALETLENWKKRKVAAAITLDESHKENIRLRKQHADDFRAKRLSHIITVKGLENLTEYCKNHYSAVLVGSDQLWLPMTAFTYFRTLRFVPEGMRRISYATSLGVSDFPRYTWKKSAEYWNAIDFLSVREQQGADIIQKICGKRAVVVLDPTYMLTKDEWEMHVPPKRIVDDGYVLCFLLGNNPAMKHLAKCYAQDHGLRLVSIMSNEIATDEKEIADEVLLGQSPESFINLIRYADCVFTDSFHGFAFSIINEKQVYVTYRVRYGTASRNSRIDGITTLLDIKHCLIQNPEIVDLPNNQIDYKLVNHVLEERRKASFAFLEGALNG